MEIEVQNIEIANGDPIVVSIPTITVDSTNENIELAVTRKEFNIIGDSVFIGNRLEDTPQWLLDYIDTLNDLALDDKINSINGLSQSLEDLIVAVDAAKNAYTSAVITYEELELMVNSKIDTLNSSLSGADSTIIEILNTKVTPTEAQTIATTALQASINNGAIGALIGSVQEAIADESSARATEIDVLTAQLDGFDDTYSTALTGLETTVANNSGVISAHSTEFTKLNTAITSGNFDTYGASNFFNTLSSEIDGAVIKAGSNFAYDSTLVIGPYAYNSGFGIKSTGSSGSNVTVDGTSYPLWNSEFWVKADNFKIVAANQTAAAQNPFSVNAATGDILLNGMVRFANTSGGTGTLQDVVQGYVETVQVGDKNINITDNLIPMTSMLTDIANAGYQFVVTPIKTSTAGISVYAEPQVQLDVDDEVYSPFVDELVVSYYYRFGIKGITALTNAKVCTIDAVDVVTYGDISYTMDAGQTLVDTDWYIIDGLINPAGGSTGIGGSIRKADGTKIGAVDVYIMPAGGTKLLLGWIGACTVSRCKLAKVNADTVTGDLASIEYVNSAVGSLGDLAYENVVEAAKLGSTVIDGGYIKSSLLTADNIVTGQLNANRLAPASGTSTVWSGGGLVSSNFNGNSTGSIGTPTQGFRLSSNAVGSSVDPNIYGGYIKGGTIDGVTMNAADIQVFSSYAGYTGNITYTTNSVTPIFYGQQYGAPSRLSSRVCSDTSIIAISAMVTTGTSSFVTVYLQYSTDSGSIWTTLHSYGVNFNAPFGLTGSLYGSIVPHSGAIMFRFLNAASVNSVATLHNL